MLGAIEEVPLPQFTSMLKSLAGSDGKNKMSSSGMTHERIENRAFERRGPARSRSLALARPNNLTRRMQRIVGRA